MITARVYQAASPATPIGSSLSQSRDREWLHQLNETGSGALKVHKRDAMLAANPTLLAYGNIVRKAIDGIDRFAWIIESRDYPPAPTGESGEQYWSVSGRGVLALLEDAIVYPEGVIIGSYQRQRRFDFTAIAYDDSAWTAAEEIQRQDDTSGYIPNYATLPVGWPDPLAYWIWSSMPTGTDPNISSPLGTSYFRKQFTVATEANVGFFGTGDNAFRVWLNGEQIFDTFGGSNVEYVDFKRFDLLLAAGTYELAVEAENIGFPAGNNPGSILICAVELDGLGQPTGSVLVRTDDSWVALDYPADVPGMTVGEIWRILLSEAQSRGGLVGVTDTFDDDDDSNSMAWDSEPDIALDIGTSYLDAMHTFVEQYVDVEMTPTLVLQLFNKGTLGSDLTGTISLTVGASREIHELASDGQDHLMNLILARDTTGRLTTTSDGTSLGDHKRREAYLELALAPSEERAQAMSSEVLVEFAYPVIQVSGKVSRDAGPYVLWLPGDTILMPDPREIQVATTIVSLAAGEDEAGHPEYSIEGLQDDASP